YETVCEINSVKGTRILDVVASCLEGPALFWWRTARKVVRVWEDWSSDVAKKRSFKYQFLVEFCGPEKQQRWMDELRSCKQKPGSTVAEYYAKLQSLYRRADPTGQYPERDFYQQFLKGLRLELRTAVRMAAANNLKEALEKAKAAEAAYSGDGPLGGYSLMSKNDDGLTKELRELKELLVQKKTVDQCDLCYKTGHTARDCPTSSIKRANRANCYNCGKPGHRKINCPKSFGEQPAKECYRCGEKGHWAKECQLGEPPKQILQRKAQYTGDPRRAFMAYNTELDPEDQQQAYAYYQPTVQYVSPP